MHPLIGGNEPVGEAHAPGKTGRNSIVAIAGNEAADATNSIAHRDGRSGEVKHTEGADFCLASQPYKNGDAGKEAPEPGKSRPVKDDLKGLVHKHRRLFQHMPKFGSGDAAHSGVGSHANGVRINAMASKITIKGPTGTDGC